MTQKQQRRTCSSRWTARQQWAKSFAGRPGARSNVQRTDAEQARPNRGGTYNQLLPCPIRPMLLARGPTCCFSTSCSCHTFPATKRRSATLQQPPIQPETPSPTGMQPTLQQLSSQPNLGPTKPLLPLKCNQPCSSYPAKPVTASPPSSTR